MDPTSTHVFLPLPDLYVCLRLAGGQEASQEGR